MAERFDIIVSEPKIQKVGDVLARKVLGFPNYHYYEELSDDSTQVIALYIFHVDNPTIKSAIEAKDRRIATPDVILVPDDGLPIHERGRYRIGVVLNSDVPTVLHGSEVRQKLLFELQPWWWRLSHAFDTQFKELSPEDISRIIEQRDWFPRI